MSIPPLVCSTPPPPDQCEDDKDPDDFDLQYNLSQEDDETYDYGGFTNYSQFQFQSTPSTSREKSVEIITAPVVQSELETVDYKIQTNECEGIPETFVNRTSDCKVEEEINIEDLNLNIDEDVIEKPDFTEEAVVEKQDVFKVLEAGVKNDDDLRSTDSCDDPTNISRVVIKEDDVCSSELPIANDLFVLKETIELTQAETIDKDAEDGPADLIETEKSISQVITSSDNLEINQIPVKTAETANKLDILGGEDSEFGDFDEFHCVSGDGKRTPVLESFDNPWASEEPSDNDFGDFKATFDNESHFVKPETDNIHSNADHKPQSGDQSIQFTKMESNKNNDDFCDFEEFQSSAGTHEQEVSKEETPCQQVPFLNLRSQDNEDQFVDNVNKVLSEIFEHEMPVVEQTELGVKLESFLSETWGHLLEIDTRQPYMVNWNNSLGQKTLLKALCIDSRNILFGPKWNYNMPKYAANLSVAPLQPQKQTASPTTACHPENSNADKSGEKSGMWSDPFDTETKEFTYAEALLLDLEHLMATLDQMANNHSTVKISELLSHACNPDSGSEKPVVETGPIDLDVFEAPPSTIPDKIYSSTLNVQPIRQINLPDTHIFTPSDSETPRSKTIHYDNVPPVLLPQTVTDNKDSLKSLTPQPSTSGTSDVDTEYWDFQNFKSVPSAQDGSRLDTPTTKPNISQGTQVLKPMKVEPTMPTLNWPEPGEVKETFDDFSDFISTTNTTWNNEKQDKRGISTTHITTPSEISKPIVETNTTNAAVHSPINEATGTIDIKNPDDEFDTFQSALPPKASTELNSNLGSRDNANSAASTSLSSQLAYNNAGIDNGFNVNYSQSPTTFSDTNKVINKVESISVPMKPIPNILQPTIAKPLNTQQKSSQILQPLTLEGYSQINWPNPGIDLQDLSRFNPVETLQSLKTDLSTNSHSKMASPVHSQKNAANNHQNEDDWGEFVSSKPKQQQQPLPKKQAFPDDDEWTDFISSPNVKPQNGLNTISLNVHTNLNTQKISNQNKFSKKTNQTPLDIPSLNYVTPKSSTAKSYNDRHFQNL